MELDDVAECLQFSENTKKSDRVVGVNYYKLAELILKQVPVASVLESKEILTYYKGKYIPNGAELIHKIVVEALTPFTRSDGTTAYSEHGYREVINIIRGMSYTPASRFDHDLDIINLKNGLLNWRTLEFREHTPEYKSRIQLPIEYDPDATCPSIIKVLNTILKPEDYIKALEFIGYCLYRSYPIQKAFILLGPGKTGKSRLLDIITSFLGIDNCSSVSMHDLERDRFATSDLYGALFNGFGDMEQTDLPNVNVLKMLTSNKDQVRAQEKGKPAFMFINFAKFMFGTNKLAKVKDDTTGFYRRVEIFPCDHKFTKDEYDPDLLKRTTSPEELSGLLNLVLPYLEPLLERNEFTNTFDTETAKNRYRAASDPIHTFIELYLELEVDDTATKEDVYQSYAAFCSKNGIDCMHKNWFGRSLHSAIPKLRDSSRNIDGRNKMVWLNMRLRPAWEVENEVPD